MGTIHGLFIQLIADAGLVKQRFSRQLYRWIIDNPLYK